MCKACHQHGDLLLYVWLITNLETFFFWWRPKYLSFHGYVFYYQNLQLGAKLGNSLLYSLVSLAVD